MKETEKIIINEEELESVNGGLLASYADVTINPDRRCIHCSKVFSSVQECKVHEKYCKEK